VDRLKEDHENARKLALGLSKIKEISIDLDSVQTNIVIFELKEISAKVFVEALAKRGVKCGAIGPRKIRMVTHYGITSEDIDYTLKAVKAVIDDLSE
jgi:threonine aldolase